MFIIYIDKNSTDQIKMRWLVDGKDTMTMWVDSTWSDEMIMGVGQIHFDWILKSDLFDILHYETES